jgi:DamX protein
MSDAESFASRPDYLKAYSLTCEPFANTLDGRFFYGGSALMQRLDLLTHLTQFGESVILVSGPQGSGKTALLGRFVSQTGKNWRLCLIGAEEFGQFRQRLGDALGIGDGVDEQQMLEQWAAQSDVAQLLVIVIDNAQKLPADALHRLCGLLDRRLADRVRLIMFGTPETQSAFKQAMERKNLPCAAQLLEIPKLSEEETAAYLMYRLAVAGYSGESPFTPTEVRAICKAADGRPAGINRLAHEALLEHQVRLRSKRLRPHRNPSLLRGAASGLASLLVLGGAIYLAWEHVPPTDSTDSVADRGEPGAREQIPLSLPEPQPVPTPAEPPPATTAAAARPDLPAAETRPGFAALPPVPTVQTPAPAEPQEHNNLPSTGTPEQSAPATLAADEQRQAPEPPPVIQAEAGSAAKDTTPAVAKAPVSPVAQMPAEPAKPVRPSPEPLARASEGPHREDWLLQQPPGMYSLQLLGSRNEKSIIDYIRHNRLRPEETAYYRGSYKGGEWYVLVYGIFPSRQSAMDARASLPVRVRQEKPWPRSLASVHTAIREVQ